MHFPHADAVSAIITFGLVVCSTGMTRDNNPGGSDGAPGRQQSPRRRAFFGADVAPLPEMREVVALGSGASPVRSAKSASLTRLILRTERIKAARTAAQRERRRVSSAVACYSLLLTQRVLFSRPILYTRY